MGSNCHSGASFMVRPIFNPYSRENVHTTISFAEGEQQRCRSRTYALPFAFGRVVVRERQMNCRDMQQKNGGERARLNVFFHKFAEVQEVVWISSGHS